MSESTIPLKWRRLARLWPLTMIFLGIILSLGWAALLGWLMVRTFGGFI